MLSVVGSYQDVVTSKHGNWHTFSTAIQAFFLFFHGGYLDEFVLYTAAQEFLTSTVLVLEDNLTDRSKPGGQARRVAHGFP